MVSVKGNRLPRITRGAINISRCINEKGESKRECVVCVCVAVFAWCQGRALTRVKIDVRPYQPGGLFPEPVVISRIGNRHVSPPPLFRLSYRKTDRRYHLILTRGMWKRKSNTSMKRRCVEERVKIAWRVWYRPARRQIWKLSRY